MAAKRAGVPRQLRDALRWAGTQAELARQLGVAESTVRRWAKQGVPKGRSAELKAWVEGKRSQAKAEPRSQRPRELLRWGLAHTKSKTDLATRIGVAVSTVRAWVKKGVPSEQGVLLLQREKERQQAYRQSKKAERDRLQDLMGFAGQLDKVPSFPSGQGVRSGRNTRGYKFEKRWMRELNEQFIVELSSWVMSHKRRYVYWQAVVRMMHFHPDKDSEFKRSGPNVIVQLGEGEDYLIDATMTTPRSKSQKGLAGELTGMLEDVIEQGFYAFIIGVSVFNYRLRTPEERRSWLQSQKRGVVKKEQERKRRVRERRERKRQKYPALPPKPTKS